MAGNALIEAQLAALGRRLPADTLDELADGLHETWRHHRARGLPPDDAARAAIAEFGTADQITRAFVVQAPGRRTARLLLATGPAVGACWGATLLATRAWTWRVPVAAATPFLLTFAAVLACLTLAATTRYGYQRARLGTAGALGLIALDATALTAAVLAAPTWPTALAIGASLARIALVLARTRVLERLRGPLG